jgi:hypothetical protein
MISAAYWSWTWMWTWWYSGAWMSCVISDYDVGWITVIILIVVIFALV